MNISMPYLLLLIVVDDCSLSRYSQGPLTERTGPIRVIWSNHCRTWVVEKYFLTKEAAGSWWVCPPCTPRCPVWTWFASTLPMAILRRAKVTTMGECSWAVVGYSVSDFSLWWSGSGFCNTFSWQQCGMVLSCWTPFFSMRGDSFTPVNRWLFSHDQQPALDPILTWWTTVRWGDCMHSIWLQPDVMVLLWNRLAISVDQA